MQGISKRNIDINRFLTFSTINMAVYSEAEAFRKREKVQRYFWGIVGSAEHMDIP